MDFWDVVWFIIISFAFVAYLMVMFTILTDLFRDRDTSGVMKAVWVVCLIFLPLLTSLVYLISRGKGMTERSMQDAAAMRRQQDEYIREVAANGQSPADQIAKAREMLDAGVITQPEYERLKEKALV
jgi:hypothetical protein